MRFLRRVPLGAALAFCLGLAQTLMGCAEVGPRPSGTLSLGRSNQGLLLSGLPLADQGEGFVRARPGESSRFGTPRLLGAIARSAASVARTFAGTAPLRVGDLSAPGGGRHRRHGSHRTGRDVDLVFYLTDALGRSVRGRSWLAFDRFGAAREGERPGGVPGSGQLYFFDDARNWHLVRTLLLDPEAQVQWIFCSRGLKARLLRYAAANEPSREALFRASWVLQQPTRSTPHRDHFHVRVSCGAAQRSLGCRDRGPIWPWLREEAEKEGRGGEGLSDALLLRALLEDAGRPEQVAAR